MSFLRPPLRPLPFAINHSSWLKADGRWAANELLLPFALHFLPFFHPPSPSAIRHSSGLKADGRRILNEFPFAIRSPPSAFRPQSDSSWLSFKAEGMTAEGMMDCK